MLPYLHEVLLQVPTEIQKKKEGKSAENISSYEPTREAFISAIKKKLKTRSTVQHKMSICWPSTKKQKTKNKSKKQKNSSLVDSCYRFTTAGQCSFVTKSILLMMQLNLCLVRGLCSRSAGQFTSKLRVYCKASQL